MLYFMSRPDGIPVHLFDNAFAAGLLTPPMVDAAGRARFELAATEAADLVLDVEGGVLVNIAEGVALPFARDGVTGALVVAAVPPEVVQGRQAEAGSWRDAPAPEPGSHLPRGLGWDPMNRHYMMRKAAADAEREGVARG